MGFHKFMICDKCHHRISVEVDSPDHYNDKTSIYIECICGGKYDKENGER